MPEMKVKKVVTVCFLEAAKLTLGHIAAHRLQLSQQGLTGTPELPRIYGDLRRMRDYLQRCASGYQETVVLELSDTDAALLVACCRRSVEFIEIRLTDAVCPPDERDWLGKKRQVLADWAVEIAAKPLLDLPLEPLEPMLSGFSRALNVRLQDKVFGAVETREQFRSPTAGPSMSGPGGASSLSRGVSSFGDALAGAGPAETDAWTGMPVEPPAELAVSAPALLDKDKIQDPRLRSLATIDLAALERCEAMQDYRLSVVMLASVLESALLDHAIPRRAELGLTGTPDTWAMPDLLIRAMGAAGGPKDRSLAFHLFASRNLLRPALQMMTPTVVTANSFDRLREFVSRALHALGFGAAMTAL